MCISSGNWSKISCFFLWSSLCSTERLATAYSNVTCFCKIQLAVCWRSRYILAHTLNITIIIEGETLWLDLDRQIAVTTGIFTFAFIYMYEDSVYCHFFIAFVPFWQSRQQVKEILYILVDYLWRTAVWSLMSEFSLGRNVMEHTLWLH